MAAAPTTTTTSTTTTSTPPPMNPVDAAEAEGTDCVKNK